MWEFAKWNPGVSMICFIFAVMLVRSVVRRALRAAVIALRGWPQAPIDADGDVVYPNDPDKIADAVIEKLEERRSLRH